ncbi:hypothetical protein D9613_005481 [Agrocybe pediades]|uniref:C2 domain-containing protein n=1 Tax=Agrocybe pediades TaxID=84607 RepID=A0A8H4QZ74_9AGAR|nr:hypothetical protein D9613_005481 [Agrocybe pediades]
MSSTPREIGTLIVVVLRANHLPNKRHIGKQDPYCLVTVNGEKRRTKAIKRGGQHPEWDEEIRFTLFEDVDDVLARTAHGNGTPPPPPPKDDKKTKRIKGGKTMKVACYADDPREPDLIGETEVDLTEVLTKGETDEWFTLTYKDKFAGKVYLELTFWSNEPPPEKKQSQKPPKNNKQYAGPGSFVPLGEGPSGSLRPDPMYDNHSRQNSDAIPIPSSLRASSSAANLDLYVAPYERSRINQRVDNLTQEFSEFGVSGSRRRESFPVVAGSYSQHHHQPDSTYTAHPPYGYEQTIGDSPSSIYNPYDRPMSAIGQGGLPQQTVQPGHQSIYPPTSYQPPYEMAPSTAYQAPARGPRHSVPTSSGFVPISQSSGFIPLQSHASEPSGFAPPPSHTPAPVAYTSQFHQPPTQPAFPIPSNTPSSANNGPYIPHSSSLSFHPQQLSASQSYQYTGYSIPQSASAPPQQFISSVSQPNIPHHANSTPPQIYSPTPPDSQHPQAPPVQASHMNGQSRPLPQQPQVVYAQQPIQQSPIRQPSLSSSQSLPPPSGFAPQANQFGPTQSSNVYTTGANGFSSIPPPPPPPLQYNAAPSTGNGSPNPLPIPPPPPPPSLPKAGSEPRRRASLPQPPVAYQQPVYQQSQQYPLPPPPPPPPLDYYSQNGLPVPPPPPPIDAKNSTQNGYHSALPPRPPVVDEYGQWTQQNNIHLPGQQTSQAY